MTRARDVSSRGGLTQIIPTSLTVSGGSASVSANGGITVTGVSAITINNCFNSTFENYKMVINAYITVGAQPLYAQMTANGTPNTSTSWYYGGTYITHSAGPTRAYSAATASAQLAEGNDISSLNDLTFAYPAQAKQTFVNSQWGSFGSTYNEIYSGSALHSVSTAFDGVKFTPNAGTFTGTIRIYGYNNG